MLVVVNYSIKNAIHNRWMKHGGAISVMGRMGWMGSLGGKKYRAPYGAKT